MTVSAESIHKPSDIYKGNQKLKEASHRIMERSRNGQTIRLRLVEDSVEIEISAAAGRILAEIFSQIADGNAGEVKPQKAEMTTQEAADLLYVSRPYLVNLLDAGQIPSRKVGTHRRILREDVAAYKIRIDEARMATLNELAAQAQELGMGY